MKTLIFFLFFSVYFFTPLTALSDVSVPPLTCSVSTGEIKLQCVECEAKARNFSSSADDLKKQSDHILNLISKLNTNGASPTLDLQKEFEQAVKEKVFKVKMDALFDIAVYGLQKWPDLSNWPNIHEKNLINSKGCQFNAAAQYAASKKAALYVIPEKDKGLKENLVISRLKIVLQTRADLNELGQLRQDIARQEIKTNTKEFLTITASKDFYVNQGRAQLGSTKEIKDSAQKVVDEKKQSIALSREQIEKNKKRMEELEKKLFQKDILFQAPDLFEAKSAFDFKIDSLRSNRSVESFAPNSLYKDLENFIDHHLTEKKWVEGALNDQAVTTPELIAVGDPDQGNDWKKVYKENQKELDKIFSDKYHELFKQAQKEAIEVCSQSAESFYTNDIIVMAAVEDLLKSNKWNRDQVFSIYKHICSMRQYWATQNEKMEYWKDKISVWGSRIGMVSIALPVGGWAASGATKALLSKSGAEFAVKIATIGSRVRMPFEVISETTAFLYASSLLTEGTLGYRVSGYDRDIKQLAVLTQMAKSKDATEQDQIKGEIAETLLRAGKSQLKLATDTSRYLQGGVFLMISARAIKNVIDDIKDVQGLASVRETIGLYGAGKLDEKRFLENLYKIQNKETKIDDVKFAQWLKTSIPQEFISKTPSLSQVNLSEVRRAALNDVAKIYPKIKWEGASITFNKFQSADSIEAARAILAGSLRAPDYLKRIEILKAVSESTAKQKYIALFNKNGVLTNADKAILETWKDEEALLLIIYVRQKAQAYASRDLIALGRENRAWDKALREELGEEGVRTLCVKMRCPLCHID